MPWPAPPGAPSPAPNDRLAFGSSCPPASKLSTADAPDQLWWRELPGGSSAPPSRAAAANTPPSSQSASPPPPTTPSAAAWDAVLMGPARPGHAPGVVLKLRGAAGPPPPPPSTAPKPSACCCCCLAGHRSVSKPPVRAGMERERVRLMVPCPSRRSRKPPVGHSCCCWCCWCCTAGSGRSSSSSAAVHDISCCGGWAHAAAGARAAPCGAAACGPAALPAVPWLGAAAAGGRTSASADPYWGSCMRPKGPASSTCGISSAGG